MKDKIYGTIIGGALGDILCSTQAQLEHRYGASDIRCPSDLVSRGIEPYWTESTATFLALLRALYERTDPICEYRKVKTYACSQVYLDPDTLSACNNQVEKHRHNPCSLVRTCAVSLYYHNSYEDLLREAYCNSMLTHNCIECADVCKLFSSIIDNALHGRSKKEILSVEYYGNLQLSVELWGIMTDNTVAPSLDLNSSQMVLCLVLQYFKKSNNFTEGMHMILASDMKYKGYVGALYGQLAGAYYGLTDIDESWLDNLDSSYFMELADAYVELTDAYAAQALA